MIFDMSKDKDFGAILQDVDLAKGLLKDAWVKYKGEDWYPVIIKDRQSGIRGFEVNFSGKWGKNDKVGRKKLCFEELVVGLADGAIPSFAAIRCKRLEDTQRNGRDVCELKLSTRLNGLIARLRTNNSRALPTLNSTGSLIEISGDQRLARSELNGSSGADSLDHSDLPEPDNADAIFDASSPSSGYESDPVIRKAVEQHAVEKALSFYMSCGYSVTPKGKPYDILCEKLGEIIHVEVKGSRFPLSSINVTTNEIKDARNIGWRTDLFLVENIVLENIEQDSYRASGGCCRLARNWLPDDKDMTPTQYRYKLPNIPDLE